MTDISDVNQPLMSGQIASNFVAHPLGTRSYRTYARLGVWFGTRAFRKTGVLGLFSRLPMSFLLIRGLPFPEAFPRPCTDATPLHRAPDIERAEIDALLENLLLNPANVLAIGRDDPDFVQLEKSSKVLFLAVCVPPEQRVDDSTHSFEVQVSCEINIIVLGCTKFDVHNVFRG